MIEATLVLVHGYGVRASFWEKFAELAQQDFHKVLTPSFDHANVESAQTNLREYLGQLEAGENVVLMGHSLGGVVSAMIVQDAAVSAKIRGTIVMSSPWGGTAKEIPGLARFLLAHGLLPGWMVRKRFFGATIPVKAQKELFANAVGESPALREAISRRPWFHTGFLRTPASGRVLGMGSACDHIVASAQTREMTAALGGDWHEFPAELGMGHDDIAVSDEAASLVYSVARGWIQSEALK